jgi:transcriptional regulator with XRE-family HTH domain
VSRGWFTDRVRTRLQIAADRAAEASLRSVGEQLRHLREDAGLPKAEVARVAGIDATYLGYIEAGQRDPTIAALSRVSAALGADLGLKVFPNAGPRLRDRFQSRMIEALLELLPPDWERFPEVPVYRPVRGVIDLVIARRASGRIVSIEAQSDLRRLEQQLRWAAEKSDALPSAAVWPALTANDRTPAVSRILLLRSTERTRSLARDFASTLAAAYAADPVALLDGLLDPGRPWPGNGILWARVDGREASIIRGLPRGARPTHGAA